MPWNARYSFPSQANKAIKITPRIPPKNGYTFSPGNTVRVEFPAQGYVNPNNTTLEFDVDLAGYGTVATVNPNASMARFQNNIQSIFSRVRLLYGSTPLEDIINYNVIVRALTEWTAPSQQSADQTSIAEGIGGITAGWVSATSAGFVNTRSSQIHGQSGIAGQGCVPNLAGASISGVSTSRRRYQITFALGLFNQDKLIPTKFMASQLAIELTLAAESGCIFAQPNTLNSGGVAGTGNSPTYAVTNVNLIPEILEFDASYDAMFLKGLQEGGVPIKFSSWHSFLFTQGAGSTANLLIQERSRSVKAIFAVLRITPDKITNDSGGFLNSNVAATTLDSYQFRIGGRYFPASPVICSNSAQSTGTPNGACEALLELQKALNVVGDYRLKTANNAMRWGAPFVASPALGVDAVKPDCIQVSDYLYNAVYFSNSAGTAGTLAAAPSIAPFAGALGSGTFAMAVSLETSNGMEISGLNAEEQSDISLMCTWSGLQNGPTLALEVYTYYDGMLILRENNVLELIQ